MQIHIYDHHTFSVLVVTLDKAFHIFLYFYIIEFDITLTLDEFYGQVSYLVNTLLTLTMAAHKENIRAKKPSTHVLCAK